MTTHAGRRWASLLLMGASGFAGLGYQIVWTQQCALWLGHEAPAVLAVVAAFFGGLAMGAWLLGGRIERSSQPARWYAGCELVIALWALLLTLAMPALSGWMVQLTGVQPSPLWQWLVAFSGTFLALLPATAAMGATLPAMERLTAGNQGGSVADLYAINTAGAVLGVLAAAFVLIPALGLTRTVVACATLNVACGLGALVLFPRHTPASTPTPVGAGHVLWRLAVTGLLGIGYEVLVVRVLSQVTENTVYTFATLLAVYLVGTAGGAALYRRARRFRPDGLLAALAAACLLGTTSLWLAETLNRATARALGGGLAAAILAEAVPAVLSFGPPTFVMGAVFAHLCRQAQETGVGFGRALAVNTLGGAVAPALFGVALLPALGPKNALALVAGGYLALVHWRGWRRPAVWLPAAGALALAAVAPALRFIDVPPGGRVVSYADGVMAAVSVVEDEDGVARLRINNRQQEGSSATGRVDARQAWLPLLLHPERRTALFLGLGTGVTAASATEEPTLEVDAVELVPEVIAASALFVPQTSRPVRVWRADARRYVRAAERLYDVIVSDNFHPARSGSGSLYTVEHFTAVRERLQPGGLFCQWLPLHQLDLRTMKSIVASFLQVNPQGWALLASNSLETPVVGLVAWRDPRLFDPTMVRRRLDRARMARLGLEDEMAVLGSFVAGPAALRAFSPGAPVNTDDRPVVAYRAPLLTYAPDSRPRDRLVAFLRGLSLDPGELVTDAGWGRRLSRYWEARNRFIETGRDVRPSGNVHEMLAQVREPLLSVLRLSPEFRPAYDPLLSMAMALARADEAGARALLAELARLQPARADATDALRALSVRGPTENR